MDWCQQVLGIQTILEIQVFEYDDYRTALTVGDDDDGFDGDELDEERLLLDSSLPKVPVRGLAASRDIQEGETVIRIPRQALFSVSTTIDNDPVLSQVMGLEARRKHGWEIAQVVTNTEDDDSSAVAASTLTEIPLLAVALLHHRKLGALSPLYPYFHIILQQTPVDGFPFMWSKAKLRQESQGVRAVVKGIRQDMRDMYTNVVQVLVDEHPDIFGNATAHAAIDDDKAGGEAKPEWMFSFEHFQWAFAMVNSRHWQLPIPDLTAGHLLSSPKSPSLFDPRRMDAVPSPPVSEEEQLLPPAEMPTDHYIQAEQQQQGLDNPVHDERTISRAASATSSLHSFLAPVADLLNFGPPCTRGHYNDTTHSFEIIATCAFCKGQEVTFWYSDDCDDVMIAVYGFTHPMVPKCATTQEHRRMSEALERQTKELQAELEAKDELVRQLDAEVVFYQDVLEECSCCKYEKFSHKDLGRRKPENDKAGVNEENQQPPSLLRHEHVRGAVHNGDEAGRRRVRKKSVEEEEPDEF
jgi:hypothetical protein